MHFTMYFEALDLSHKFEGPKRQTNIESPLDLIGKRIMVDLGFAFKDCKEKQYGI